MHIHPDFPPELAQSVSNCIGSDSCSFCKEPIELNYFGYSIIYEQLGVCGSCAHMVAALYHYAHSGDFGGLYPSPFIKQKQKNRNLSPTKALQVFSRNNYQCVHCGIKNDLCVDHIKPVSLGGSNDLSNLQTLCRSCNSKKGVKYDGAHTQPQA